MISAPPLEEGAVQDTVSTVLPAFVVSAVGAPGTAEAGDNTEDVDPVLVPALFTADTVNV